MVKTERVKELEKLLTKYSNAYYNEGIKLVSDSVFDQLQDELRQLDPKSTVLMQVGPKKITGATIKHDILMLSADKVYDPNGVLKWASDYPNALIIWGFKVDGLSFDIEYQHGKILNASTRGTIHGTTQYGQDRTNKVFYLQDVPRELPGDINCHVRGEVYMTISDFERINATLVGDDKFECARNLAAGTLALLDPLVVKQRNLRFMAWDLLSQHALSTLEKIDQLRAWGFVTANQGLINPQQIPGLFNKITEVRGQYDFEMDGLIFQFNDSSLKHDLGSTGHAPRWLMALKFEPDEGVTRLLEIEWNVAGSHKIAPRAITNIIELANSRIKHFTLYNARFVIDNDLAPGDDIQVVRSGDVIPKVIGVIKLSSHHASLPSTCPVCGGATEMRGADLYCTNLDCGQAKTKAIQHFIDFVDLKGMGPASLQVLWDAGAVKKASDLFKLDRGYLVNALGENGKKIYEVLQKLRVMPISIFLSALNIRSLGKTVSVKLAQNARSIDDITPEYVRSVLGNGKIADNVIEGIKSKPWKPFITAGVKIMAG